MSRQLLKTVKNCMPLSKIVVVVNTITTSMADGRGGTTYIFQRREEVPHLVNLHSEFTLAIIVD